MDSEEKLIFGLPDIEILISTMNRTDLLFLERMFQYNSFQDFSILIINQTDKSNILTSTFPNVRVINDFDKGISKSRNLAIKKMERKIGIVADDDIVFVKNFADIVLEGHNKYPDAAVVCHKIKTFSNEPYKLYSEKEKFLGRVRGEHPISSVEISFKRDIFHSENLYFDERFGLGTSFPSGEEDLLLMNMLKKNLKLVFVPEYIVLHSLERSTTNQGSDEFIRAKVALKYVEYKNLSHLWLLKFLLFLIREKFISYRDLYHKYKVGRKSIAEIKQKKEKEDI